MLARALCLAATLLLAGCFETKEQLFDNVGDRLMGLVSSKFACGSTVDKDKRLRQVRIREINKGWLGYTYAMDVPGDKDPAIEFAFHAVHKKYHYGGDNRYIVTQKLDAGQRIYLAHVTSSSLTVLNVAPERITKLASPDMSVTQGYGIATLSGDVQSQRDMILQMARVWVDMIPTYVCVALF